MKGDVGMKFEYKKEFSKTLGTIYRPVAEVFFIHEDKEIRDFPYVDSGADITLIPRSVGELLGFEVEKEKIVEMGGIGGSKVPTILKKIKIRIDSEEFPIQVAWALIEDVPPLLGRTDVFDRFEVTFKQKEKVTEFKKLR